MTQKLRIIALPLKRGKEGALFAYVAVRQPKVKVNDTSVWTRKVNEAREEGSDAYAKWSVLPDDDWKKKMVVAFEKARAQIDPHEVFAASISSSLKQAIAEAKDGSAQVELVYPRNIVKSDEEMRNVVRAMLEQTHSTVNRYMLMYTLATPVTALMAVLPGPNVFFAANALRLFSLWQCRYTLNMLESTKKIEEGTPELVLIPSDCNDLNTVGLSDEQVARILGGEGAPMRSSMTYVDSFRAFLDGRDG